MIETHEVYTIETWMMGQPLPKRKQRKKKGNETVVSTLEQNVKVVPDAAVTFAVGKETMKRSTSEYLKDLAERMKSSPGSTSGNVEKVDATPIQSNTAKVLSPDETSLKHGTQREEKNSTSSLSDDLWSLLQTINKSKSLDIDLSEPTASVRFESSIQPITPDSPHPAPCKENSWKSNNDYVTLLDGTT